MNTKTNKNKKKEKKSIKDCIKSQISIARLNASSYVTLAIPEYEEEITEVTLALLLSDVKYKSINYIGTKKISMADGKSYNVAVFALELWFFKIFILFCVEWERLYLPLF